MNTVHEAVQEAKELGKMPTRHARVYGHPGKLGGNYRLLEVQQDYGEDPGNLHKAGTKEENPEM